MAAKGADSARIADLAVSTWRDVDKVLSPIIGHRGVVALYRRSLFLTCTAHPCLGVVDDFALQPGDFSGLRVALAQQTPVSAGAAAAALTQTFDGLIANLIGTWLTERLLSPVWDTLTIGDAVQEHSP
ncbi:MAG: hypothetical protein ABIS68_11580 [Casimicrobiaceae bacterium]